MAGNAGRKVRGYNPALRVSVGCGPWAPNQARGIGMLALVTPQSTVQRALCGHTQCSYLQRVSLETRLHSGDFIGSLRPSVICRADLAVLAPVVRRWLGGMGNRVGRLSTLFAFHLQVEGRLCRGCFLSVLSPSVPLPSSEQSTDPLKPGRRDVACPRC